MRTVFDKFHRYLDKANDKAKRSPVPVHRLVGLRCHPGPDRSLFNVGWWLQALKKQIP